MGHNEFWLQFNNGKKEQLNDTKHGVRKEQVDKKFHNLFDAYDANNDGTLEEKEVQTIFGHLKNFAGDNVLDSAENLKAKSVFAEGVNIENADFMGFVKSVSDATSNIISSEETKTSDGGKEIKTEYKDGTTETIAYYQNGDFKWKKIEKRFAKTTYEMILDGKRQELTEEQYNQALKKLNEKPQPQQKPKANFGIEGQNRIVFPQPTPSVEVKTTTNKWEEHTQEYSPRFVAEKLGVDINSQEGKKIVERMSYLPKEGLDQIKDGAELKDIIAQNDLPPNFDNISNVLELMYGVTLRNEEEYEASKPQREKIIQQIQTVGIMSELYARVAEFNDTYTDNQGVFGLGSEGIGWILNKIGIQGENHYQWADSCREFIEKINDFKVLNPAKFEQEFKELTGKEKFNVEALQKMVELAKDGKAQDEYGDYTDEYKQAVKEFSNFDVTNINARAWYHPDNLISGFGEALIMIGTLGYGAETKAGQMLATSTMATFSKAGVAVASKQVNNRLLQGALRISGKGIKLIGPALNEGTKMYAYTAVMGTATNIANRAIKFDSEENTLDKFLQTEAMVLDSATGSFGFGAFAGVFGSTVTQKVMQRASRVSQKVGTALSDKFAKGAVDANEVFTTILEKSAPTKIAEVAAFATDVLGFTAFESVLAIIKNLDNFPDGYSVEDLANVIWEELKNQGYNLFQIKIVAWLMSSRSARMQATRYMKDAMPQLKGATVEWVNEGKDGYKINLPDGRKVECKNTTEYISALQLMVRGETAFSGKFDIKNTNRGTETSDVAILTTQGETIERRQVQPTNTELSEPDFAEISNDFAQNHKSYELYSDNDGNNVVMIVAVAGERPNASAGIPFTYEVYRFDKDGKQIAEPLKGLSEKEVKKYQLENKQFIDNRISDNSGTLNSFIIPLPKKIRELLFNDKKIKEESKSFESQIQELENNLAKRPNMPMPKFLISKILEATNKDNIKLAEKLCKNSYVLSFDFIEILKATNKDNIELAERLSDKKTYSKFVTKDLKNLIPKILKVTNKDNINIAIELCFDKKVPKDKVADILLQKNKNITDEKIKKIEQQLSLDKEISQDKIANILKNINQDNIKLADMICSDRTFPKEEIAKILSVTNNENINTAIQLYLDKNVLPNQIAYKIMQSDSDEVRINRIMQIASGDFHHEAIYMWCPELAEILCFDERFPKDKIGTVCQFSRSQDYIKEITEIVRSLCADKDFPRDYMANILKEINKYNLELFQQLYSDKEFPRDQIAGILYETRKNNIDTAKMLCSDKDFPKGKIENIIKNIREDNLELFNQLYSDKEFPRDQIAGILYETRKNNIDAAKMLCGDKNFPRDKIKNIIANIREDNFELFNQLYYDKEFPRDQIAGILRWTNDTNIEVFNTLYADKEFPKNLIVDILHKTKSYDSTTRKFNNPICIELFNKLYADKKFPRDKIAILLSGEGNSGNYLADKDVNSLDEAVKLQKANVLQYPEKYVNGKYSSVEGIQLAVNVFFNKQYCNLLLISEIFDKQTVNNFLRMRFEKATDYMKILQNFSNYELDLLKQLSNSKDITGKPFLSTQKIELIDLIEAYRVSKLSTSKIEEMIKTGKVDIAQLKKDIFAEILKRAGMTDDEIASIPNEKITAWDVKYAHFLSKEVQDNHDSAFDDIIRVANLDDFNRYIHDTDNIYGQANKKTQTIFEKGGLNYDEWKKPSKDNELDIVAINHSTEQLNQIALKLIKDMNTLMQTPVKGFLKKQFPKFIQGDNFVIPNEYLNNKTKLTELIKLFTDTSEQGQLSQIWKRASNNLTNPEPNRSLMAKNTMTILDHLNQRLDDLDKIQDIPDGNTVKEINWKIKMWDRIPQKDLFQGNYSTCCIAMGGVNGDAMPHYLMNTAYNMIEIVDNITSKTVGNALCYFIKGENEKPALVIDNIEINNSNILSDDVGIKVRDAVAQYALNVAKKVAGNEDTHIYMSSENNDVPIEGLKPASQKIEFLGEIDCDEIYMDLYKGWTKKDEFVQINNNIFSLYP